MLEEGFQEHQMIHVARQHRGMALIDVGEILDLFGIQFGEHLGHAEPVNTGVFEHPGGAKETGLHHTSGAMAAELAGRGSPLHAPKATDIGADGVTTMDA